MMTIDKTIEAIEALPNHERRGILAFFTVDTNEPTVFCLSPDLKALATELKELREFVGAMNRVAIEEWHGHWLRTDEPQFAFYDSDGECVASGTDPFDAWRKMNAGEGE